MINPATSYQRAYRAGFAVLGLLIVHAVIYYKERIALADDSFYLYEMARTGKPTIQHFRFVSLVTEWLPLIGIRLHASLSVVAILWSAAFPLFYLFCYAVCGSLLRSPQSALCLLVYLILFSTHTHYWCISELSLGAALLFVLLAYALCRRPWRIPPALDPIGLLLLFFIGFAHPLLIFAVAFLLVFGWLRFPLSRGRLLGYAIQYAFVLIVKFVFFKEVYESSAMAHIDNFKNFFPDYIHHHSNGRLLRKSFGIWCGIPLGSIAVISVYLMRRSWLKLGLFAGMMGGFLLLVNITHPDALVQTTYIENLYLPLGVFLALPLIFDVWPQSATRPGAMAAFAIIAALCLLRIWNAHTLYTARVAWLRRVMDAHEGRKVILESWRQPQDIMMWGWGPAYEIWLLSTIERGHAASVIMHEHEGLMPGEADNNPRMFIGPWGVTGYNELPRRYFPFDDTLSTYQHIWDWPATPAVP